MMQTVEEVARRAVEAGKPAATYVVDPASAGRFVAMGYRLLPWAPSMRCSGSAPKPC